MLGVLGDLVEDIVVWLGESLQHATDTDVSVHRTRGGSAANVAAFAGPRHPTRFIGRVGNDAVGGWLADELAGHGVEVRVQRAGVTGTIVVLVDEHGERTMLPSRGAAVRLTGIDESWTAGLEHLHLPAYSLAAEPIGTTSVEAARRVRRQDGTVSIDASSTRLLRRYGRERFLALAAGLAPRLLFANRDEADLLGLADGPGLAGHPRLAGTTVVVKDGAHPTTVRSPGREPFRVPVPPITGVRDLTGAGDAFAAGFLTATLGGADARAACAAGHEAAASVLRTPGATTPSIQKYVRRTRV